MPISRRSALWSLGTVLSGLTLEVVAAAAVEQDSTKALGPPVSEYGTRSPFESKVVRWNYKTATKESSWTMTPLHDQRGILTPSSLQYERHHAGVPNIDPSTHFLYIIGMVERPLKL